MTYLDRMGEGLIGSKKNSLRRSLRLRHFTEGGRPAKWAGRRGRVRGGGGTWRWRRLLGGSETVRRRGLRQLQVARGIKSHPASAGELRDLGSIPGRGRSSGRGRGNPLQYSYLENPLDRGAWRATVRRVAKSDTTDAY